MHYCGRLEVVTRVGTRQKARPMAEAGGDTVLSVACFVMVHDGVVQDVTPRKHMCVVSGQLWPRLCDLGRPRRCGVLALRFSFRSAKFAIQ